MSELNPSEVIAVQNDLLQHSIKHYTIRPGNNCIWVSYGLVNAYYIFRDGRIVDVQID